MIKTLVIKLDLYSYFFSHTRCDGAWRWSWHGGPETSPVLGCLAASFCLPAPGLRGFANAADSLLKETIDKAAELESKFPARFSVEELGSRCAA